MQTKFQISLRKSCHRPIDNVHVLSKFKGPQWTPSQVCETYSIPVTHDAHSMELIINDGRCSSTVAGGCAIHGRGFNAPLQLDASVEDGFLLGPHA